MKIVQSAVTSSVVIQRDGAIAVPSKIIKNRGGGSGPEWKRVQDGSFIMVDAYRDEDKTKPATAWRVFRVLRGKPHALKEPELSRFYEWVRHRHQTDSVEALLKKCPPSRLDRTMKRYRKLFEGSRLTDLGGYVEKRPLAELMANNALEDIVVSRGYAAVAVRADDGSVHHTLIASARTTK